MFMQGTGSSVVYKVCDKVGRCGLEISGWVRFVLVCGVILLVGVIFFNWWVWFPLNPSLIPSSVELTSHVCIFCVVLTAG